MENIHLICCSDHVSVLEMAVPITNELLMLETDGITIFDGFLQTDILVLAPVLCFIGDNPRSSEFCNHLGGSAKLFCQMCLVSIKFID